MTNNEHFNARIYDYVSIGCSVVISSIILPGIRVFLYMFKLGTPKLCGGVNILLRGALLKL